MTRARQFIDLWNKGEIRAALSDATSDYAYTDAVLGGPFDRDGHIEVMDAILRQVPDRRITVTRDWSIGPDVEFVEYVWSGTPDGHEPTVSDWLAIFEYDGARLRSQRHYRGS